MRITNIYISWFFQYLIAILTHQEINWAIWPERQIAPLSPILEMLPIITLIILPDCAVENHTSPLYFYNSGSKMYTGN